MHGNAKIIIIIIIRKILSILVINLCNGLPCRQVIPLPSDLSPMHIVEIMVVNTTWLLKLVCISFYKHTWVSFGPLKYISNLRLLLVCGTFQKSIEIKKMIIFFFCPKSGCKEVRYMISPYQWTPNSFHVYVINEAFTSL